MTALAVVPSQNQRILAVLADARPHSVSEIHKRAGTMRLNSRVAELRSRGHDITCERVPGRKGPAAYRYTWHNAPPIPPAVEPFMQPLAPETVAPRNAEHRYRIYCVPRYGEQTLIATAPDPESVGVALVTMGREGQLRGSCLGILDTHGTEETPGEWIANPHEGRW